MKKTLRSIITVVLVLTMSPGIFSAALADAPAPTKSYVALGDSFSQGYMFWDYADENSGYANCVDRSYVKQFAALLGEDYKLTDLTIQGMRPATLYGLFVPDMMTEPDWDVLRHYNWWEDFTTADFSGLEEMGKFYREAVKNADIITYDLGMSDFGILVVDTIMKLIAQEDVDVPSAAQFISKPDENSAVLVELLREKLHELLDENVPGLPAADIIETLVYAYASFIVYFEKTAGYIFTVNPDVELIVLPLFNPLSDLYLSVDGMEQPLQASLLFDVLFESFNVYLTMNDYASLYKFAYYDKTPILFPDELYYNEDGTCSDDLKWNIAGQLIGIVGGEASFAAMLNTINGNNTLASASADDVYYAYKANEPTDGQKTIVSAFDKILTVLTAAMQDRNFSLDFLAAVFSGSLPVLGAETFMKDVSELTHEEKLALHAMLKFTTDARSYGMHPAPSAMDIKYNAVKKAHSSKFAANGTVLNIVIDTAADINEGHGVLIESLIDTLLFRNRSFLAKLTDFIRSIFNVIEKLPINI